MRATIATATAVAICLSGVAFSTAADAGGAKKCFDKSSLSYVDCAVLNEKPEEPTFKTVPFTDGAEQEGAYFAVRGGYMAADDLGFNAGGGSSVDAEFGAGYVASGALGYQFTDIKPAFDLRIELELGYQEAEIDQALINGAAVGADGEAGVAYAFLNAYGDLQVAPKWELFLGGGVGAGVVDFEDSGIAGLASIGDSDPAFGYHLDAGASYQISKDVSLEAGYRYSSFLGAEIGSAGDEIDVDSHQFLVGVKFKM